MFSGLDLSSDSRAAPEQAHEHHPLYTKHVDRKKRPGFGFPDRLFGRRFRLWGQGTAPAPHPGLRGTDPSRFHRGAGKITQPLADTGKTKPTPLNS